MGRPTRYFKGAVFEDDPNAIGYVLIDGEVKAVPKSKIPRTGKSVFIDPYGFVFISTKTPRVASKTLINGEVVHCAANGETLELDSRGPVRVNDANEKAAYLKSAGAMPAPERRFRSSRGGATKPRGERPLKKSFRQQFHEDHGYGLEEHMRTRYPGQELTLDLGS